MATYKEVGRRVRQARTELGLMQADLGRMLARQRSHAAISDIERGKTKLDLEELAELARVLHKPLDFFTVLGPNPAPSAGVVYRRSERGTSGEEQEAADRSIEAFLQYARQRARGEDDRR